MIDANERVILVSETDVELGAAPKLDEILRDESTPRMPLRKGESELHMAACLERVVPKPADGTPMPRRAVASAAVHA